MQMVTQLEVYESGALSVIGFGGRELLHHLNLAECREEILELVREHSCKNLAFDLTQVRLIPSGLLGLIVSIHRMGVEVYLYNPSEDIREVLKVTKLDKVFHIHEVDV